MALAIEVSLLSGRSVVLEAEKDEPVKQFKLTAQELLAVGWGRLSDSSGGILDGAATLEESRLQSGDSVTLHIREVYVCNNRYAFALILGDGSVVRGAMLTVVATAVLFKIR